MCRYYYISTHDWNIFPNEKIKEYEISYPYRMKSSISRNGMSGSYSMWHPSHRAVTYHFPWNSYQLLPAHTPAVNKSSCGSISSSTVVLSASQTVIRRNVYPFQRSSRGGQRSPKNGMPHKSQSCPAHNKGSMIALVLDHPVNEGTPQEAKKYLKPREMGKGLLWVTVLLLTSFMEDIGLHSPNKHKLCVGQWLWIIYCSQQPCKGSFIIPIL